jgi:ergothioneine biosynthesis protein EgtB
LAHHWLTGGSDVAREARVMDREWLLKRFTTTRAKTEKLAQPLSEEDCLLQAIADVSPTKWHLAHTSWFFEQFLLVPHSKKFRPFSPDYSFLFNSYYEGVGNRVERPKRGLLSRPSLDEIYRYRKFVTEAVQDFLAELPEEHFKRPLEPPFVSPENICSVVELGIHHEEQHQELVLTDIKYNLYFNPQRPAYSTDPADFPSPHQINSKTNSQINSQINSKDNSASRSWILPSWILFDEGVRSIGWDKHYFAFDNERPRHRVFIEPFRIFSHPVTNGEFLEFIEAKGYQRPEFWLSDGWATVQKNGWMMPLYWEKNINSISTFTLQGMQPLRIDDPVTHLSHYEADAFARFRGMRLPTEMEWEVAADRLPNILEGVGKTWEWTSSAYLPYPGFAPFVDQLGEYNGKFMSNQMVLRGGSLATPPHSLRPTYRNFFPPESRWQFTGMRLAQ